MPSSLIASMTFRCLLVKRSAFAQPSCNQITLRRMKACVAAL